MFSRRKFAAAAATALAVATVSTAEPAEAIAESEQLYDGNYVAQMLADMEQDFLQWKDNTFIDTFELMNNATAIIVAGLDIKLIIRMIERINGAFDVGCLVPCGSGHAPKDEAFFPCVIVYLVDTTSLERSMGMLADLLAEYPRPYQEDEAEESEVCCLS